MFKKNIYTLHIPVFKPFMILLHFLFKQNMVLSGKVTTWHFFAVVKQKTPRKSGVYFNLLHN